MLLIRKYGSAAPAGHHGRPQLAGHAVAAGVEKTVEKRTHASRRPGIVDRRAGHDGAVIVELIQHFVDLVAEDAESRRFAAAAGGTVLHGLCPQPKQVAGDARAVQRLLQFGQRGESATFPMRAAVD